uniref:Uncharacterized protein n=1 Tax=Tanacetum cinerariifolium TaxID=118510 RepID=A0A699J5V7_TANCI|nr:hypothetical protein [Tanacetum cinerariifolium]
MEKLSFDLNVRKKSSDSDEAAQYYKNIVVTLSKSHLKSTMACALHQHLTGLTLVDRPIVVKTDDPFDDLDEILERVGPMGNFKEEEVDTNNETEEESVESDTK